TREKIEYANVGIAWKNIGTISNDEGKFALLVPKSLANCDLLISSIGYKPYKVNISEIKNEPLDIQLLPENIEIEEVIVSALTAKRLVAEAVKKIPENYSSLPYMATGFYREIVKENNKAFEIVEAVLEFFKTSYLPEEEKDQGPNN
ncbi:MAG: carboxypeptidase-like regulatory domain-containing protein, partial [Chloroflexia bacterium]|nr:carboxypeptidase-like regulatory domain-containing protein [Chloroflexia bacterium]